MINYYEILEIKSNASADAIKKAFYKLAKKYHPDSSTGNAEKFREIHEAYVVLFNSETRRKYDETLRQAKNESTQKRTAPVKYEYTDATPSYQCDLDFDFDELYEAMNKLNDTIDELTKQQKRSNELEKARLRKEIAELEKEIYDISPEVGEVMKESLYDVGGSGNLYYIDPSKESIFTILFHFNDFRFENAIKALWKRWTVSMLGAALVYILALPFILLTKVLFFFRPSRERNCPIHWIGHIHNLMYRNHLITSVFWSIFLTVLAVLRFTWTTLFIIYWIFKNIIRFFLMPFAIIAGSIIMTFGKLMFAPKRL